jgi:hypothetical protein
MRAFRAFVANAALLSSIAFLPSEASALTPAGFGTQDSGLVTQVARVCRDVCRNGYCRETCRWVPDRRGFREERFEGRGRRFEGREGREERFEERRRPGVEFRVGPRRDYD